MIYLNQAATTYPKPQCVLEAHTASLYKIPSCQFRSSTSLHEADIFETCRKNLGALLGITDWQRIFFSSGATDSANAVFYGLPLAGRNVVVTCTEHNSILRPAMNLSSQVGSVTVMPCDSCGRVDIAELEEAVTAETAAIFISHCSNVTGMVQNIKEAAKAASKKQVLLIVDASQSAGCIPIAADEWGIDALIFTGHKGLFGVQGTGGYYVRDGIDFRPYRYGGTGKNSRQLIYGPGEYEYEPGTQNTPGITALNAGVQYILDKGAENIAKNEQRLMGLIYSVLETIPNVKVYGSGEHNKGPVMSFNIEGLAPADTAYILQNGYEIIVRTGLHCAPLIHEMIGSGEAGTVRVSISDLTQEQEIHTFLNAVRDIAASAGGR